MLETLALAILIGLGGFRAMRLIKKDDIFNKPRMWVLVHTPQKVSTVIMCPWCMSAYLTGAAVLFVWWLHPVTLPFLVWMAAWSWTVSQYALVDPD